MAASRKTNGAGQGIATTQRKALVKVRVRGIEPGLLMDKISVDDLPPEHGQKSPVFTSEERFERCQYRLEPPRGGCIYGLPAKGFEKACVQAARALGGITIKAAQQGLHVLPTGPDGLVAIECSEPVLHRSVVGEKGSKKVGTRALVEQWEAELSIACTLSIVKVATALDLLEEAGDAIGIGAWRPQNSGWFGRFEVLRGDD